MSTRENKPNLRDILLKYCNLFSDLRIVLWRSIEVMVIHRQIRQHINAKGPILDLGCGDGRIFSTIFGHQGIGLDIDLDAVRIANCFKIHDALVVSDASQMPFRDGIFGLVFCNSALEHMPSLDLILKEVSRTLTDKGVFILTVPNEKFCKWLVLMDVLERLRLKSFARTYALATCIAFKTFNVYDLRTWNEILAKNGLKLQSHSFYLSKQTFRLWNLVQLLHFPLSVVDFFLRKTITKSASRQLKLELSALKRARKIRSRLYTLFLRKFYDSEIEDQRSGACTFIVSCKGSA